jgi:hypothetical protein
MQESVEDFGRWVDGVAHVVAEGGPAAAESELARVAATALDRSVVPPLARLVVDRTQPDIVRSRAFGHVTRHLAAAMA